MKLHIVTNDGELIATVPDVEEYNLSKSAARADLCEEIAGWVRVAMEQGKE